MGARVGCVTIYVLGIPGYWWWNFLIQGYFQRDEFAVELIDGMPEVRHLKSWRTLSDAMTLSGSNFEEILDYRNSSSRVEMVS